MSITMKTDHKTRQVLFEGKGILFIENGTRKALYEIGKHIRKEIQDGIKNPPKTGRYYKYKSRNIRASINIEQAEYPANRSGKLRRSINFNVKGSDKMIIGASAEYAVSLEDGTKKMQSRKLFRYTIDKNSNKLKDIIRKNINGAFK